MGKKMNPGMKPLVKLAVDFINEHWDEIDKKKTEIKETKEEIIEQIKKECLMTSWIITEVMSWGCKENYVKQYVVENDGPLTLKVGSTYFEYLGSDIEGFVKTKIKRIGSKLTWIEMDSIAGKLLNTHLKSEPETSPLFDVSSKKLRDLIIIGIEEGIKKK